MQNRLETSLPSVKNKVYLDIDTWKLFFNAHIKPHTDCASVLWDECSDVLRKRLNSLHRRAVKLILPDTSLTTHQKLKKIRIMSLHKQVQYKKGLSCTRSSTMRPQRTYLTCTHVLPNAVPVLGTVSLVFLSSPGDRHVENKYSLLYAFLWDQILSLAQLL